MLTEPDARLLRDRAVLDFLQVVNIEEVSPEGVRIPMGCQVRYVTLRPTGAHPLQIVATVDRFDADTGHERETWVVSVPPRASLWSVIRVLLNAALEVVAEVGDWCFPNWLRLLCERIDRRIRG